MSNDTDHSALAERLCKANGALFAVSAVVPVYNVAPYVSEAIESVLGQTIGQDFVQVILVDDGSTDSSADICREYAERHPGNVVFVQQAHAGVSAARNTGKALAQGAYINFLDADDKWSPDAYFHALSFLEDNPSVGIVAIRHVFFGAKTGRHPLDYKFEETRVINIFDTFDYPQMSVNNTLIQADLVKARDFDPNLPLAEDFLYISQIIMQEGAYGVVKDGTYYYRKRNDGVSAIDNSAKNFAFYLQVPTMCDQALFEHSRQIHGYVLPYIQYAVMYDLRWRLQGKIQADLSVAQLGEYQSTIRKLLASIKNEYIFLQRGLSYNVKLYAYAIKEGIEPDSVMTQARVTDEHLVLKSGACDQSDSYELPLSQIQNRASLTFMTREANGLRLQGFLEFLSYSVVDAVQFEFVVDGDKTYSCELFPRHDKCVTTPFHGRIFPHIGYDALIPWDGSSRIRIQSKMTCGSFEVTSAFTFGKFTGIHRNRQHNYWMVDDAIVRYKQRNRKGTIIVEPKTFARHVIYESRLRKELRSKFPDEAMRIIKLRNAALKGQHKRKKLWLLSDRPYGAGDNGEALFRYLCAHPVPDVDVVFAISKSSADFERLSQIGTVIDRNSFDYERMVMRADLFVSSSGDDAINAAIDPVKDLVHLDYAFLQHGIIDGDLSGWINRWRKGLKLFVTSAEREAQSIANERYGYTHGEVKLVGLPRHDELLAKARTAEPSRTIYLMPTWRDYVATPENPETGIRSKNPLFKQSDYYAFYEALITNERLRNLLERYDYTMKFVLHPCFQSEVDEFTASDRISIHERYNYQEAFLDGALLVTDYSSVAFDFALLRKPVIYAQFDEEDFYLKHSYTRGYFTYESDGLGPVCHSVDETVDAIESQLKSGCQMSDTYRARADGFYFEPPEGATRCSLLVNELLKLQRAKDEARTKSIPLF